MVRLDLALDRLVRPGFGVLVLDDYADLSLRSRGLRGEAARDLVEFALHSPAPAAALGGVLLSAAHLELLRPPVAPPPTAAALGVMVPVGGDAADATEAARALESARRAGATFVELRANRRPGSFPRGETHVDASAVAVAAATAQQAGLVPVVTVALPGLAGSAVGVTRAITVNALRAVFGALAEIPHDPAGLVLRMPLMAPGPRAGQTLVAASVAEHTLAVLEEAVPAQVPAVWFLSAGHPLPVLTEQLAAVSSLAAARDERRSLGFALGRALLEPALDGWVAGGPARARQRLASSGEAAHRALVPALARS